MYITEQEAKERICSIGKKMYAKEFVSANDGNMTIRIGPDAYVATPTGVSKGDLCPDMLLVVDGSGKVLKGNMEPTTELRMHLGIYKEDDRVQSTAHAHPTYLTSIATLGATLDIPLTPATAAISGRIPVAPYCDPGSMELADSVKPFVKDYMVVMLANHGAISWGYSPLEAWHILEDAEAYAKMAIILKYILQDYRPISLPQIQLLAETHNLQINPKRLVDAPMETNNTEPAVSFATMEQPRISLDETTLDKLANRIVERLKG